MVKDKKLSANIIPINSARTIGGLEISWNTAVLLPRTGRHDFDIVE